MVVLIAGIIMLAYSVLAWQFRVWDGAMRWMEIEPRPWIYALNVAVGAAVTMLGLAVVL